MNNSQYLSPESMLQALPRVLQEDENMYALAVAVIQALDARQTENENLSIYPSIDNLPEGLLDILAYDFKIDWWNGDYSVEEKRRTLKDSWRVHRMLGTKAAVEAAISAIYPETKVQEWFEYGGKPYFFKLLIDLTDVLPNPDAHERILDRIRYYKNLRSHIEEIQYTIRSHYDAYARMGGCMAAVVSLPITEIPDTFDFEGVSHFGGVLASQFNQPIPEVPDELYFGNTARIGGTAASSHKMPVPEVADNLLFKGTSRMGGKAAARHNFAIPEADDALQFKGSVRAGGRTMTYTFMPVPEINS